MYRSLQIIFLCTTLVSNIAGSQEYLVTFSASGAVGHIDYIEVQNLTSRQTVTIDGTEVLILTSADRLSADELAPELVITPNMQAGSCSVEMTINYPGNSSVEVYNAGDILVAEYRTFLTRGTHRFKISGLKSGAHKVVVNTPNHDHTHWVMSSANHANGNASVLFVDNSGNGKTGELISEPVPMRFLQGESLLFKAFADNHSRIKVVSPVQTTHLDFKFIPCMDFDENHYAVVSIGDQVWMAQNLRTTSFNDGTQIRHIQNSLLWRELNSPAYSWYEHNENYSATHGALYNWYTVSDSRLCPYGWRMPLDEDWYLLESYIDPEINNPTATGWRGVNAGMHLKSISGWGGHPGSNIHGFSATPAGRRSFDGSYNSLGDYSYWWSMSQQDETSAWSRYILPRFEYLYRGAFSKNYGFSVRCIKE
ncbi:fibrobacter succinogenes major paralogous domain-containing protein [Alkalitalea saponilacus]|uniref:Major paralogous domain-containing protein n=1 Tax=Alkalitalea saponilacus TaxID=889453 RepID=A0A1T5FPU7_9BACT|nr:fibrobacter succinogenes major paralogous domain-containing protein [Alkalitalea saponilacus]ASB49461.1 hypothetical protein CDL62_10085 [Alkalitalea saponilacus]SKB98185.1 major paralogous domain-containing protein [Alkalitalea saponilacus]